jgi:CheY-like chemotaxis protein
MLESVDTAPAGAAFGPAAIGSPVNILLIEDTMSDALLLRMAINASRVPCNVHELPNGDEVLPWLRDSQAQKNGVLPDIILLDLGLPQLDGFQLLEEFAKAPSPVRSIPIVILTGYEHFDYIRKNHNLSIPAYLTKPCKADKIREILLPIHRRKTVEAAAL